jgi:hypothetical protein
MVVGIGNLPARYFRGSGSVILQLREQPRTALFHVHSFSTVKDYFTLRYVTDQPAVWEFMPNWEIRNENRQL